MAIQLCPVDTANVHPRNILGSSSSFDRERPLATSEKIKSSRMPWSARIPSWGSRFLASSSALLTRAGVPLCQCASVPSHPSTILPLCRQP